MEGLEVSNTETPVRLVAAQSFDVSSYGCVVGKLANYGDVCGSPKSSKHGLMSAEEQCD